MRSCTLFALLPAAALPGLPNPPPCPLITRRHDMGRSGLYSTFKTLLHSPSLRRTEDEYEWRRMRSDMEAAVACNSPVRVWKYIPKTFQDPSNRPRCSNKCQTQALQLQYPWMSIHKQHVLHRAIRVMFQLTLNLQTNPYSDEAWWHT